MEIESFDWIDAERQAWILRRSHSPIHRTCDFYWSPPTPALSSKRYGNGFSSDRTAFSFIFSLSILFSFQPDLLTAWVNEFANVSNLDRLSFIIRMKRNERLEEIDVVIDIINYRFQKSKDEKTSDEKNLRRRFRVKNLGNPIVFFIRKEKKIYLFRFSRRGRKQRTFEDKRIEQFFQCFVFLRSFFQ